jgi:hypothetical protein
MGKHGDACQQVTCAFACSFVKTTKTTYSRVSSEPGLPIDREANRSSEAALGFVSSMDVLCRKLDLTPRRSS